MSKRLLETLQQDRIDDLFRNLESGTFHVTTLEETGPLGWTWECDFQRNYIACSPEIEQVLNVPVSKFVGKSAARFMVNPLSFSALDHVFENSTYPVEVDVQLLSSNGNAIPARFCILKPSQPTNSGTSRGFSGFTSVLQRKSDWQNTRSKYPEPGNPAHKFQALTIMGKELRTSVNSILGYSRLILKGLDGPTSDLLNQDIRAIHIAGKQILEYANEIIDFSKIETGSLELNFEENVNLTEIVTSLVNSFPESTHNKSVELKQDITSNLPFIRADPVVIRNILFRLISLTVKLNVSGTILVTVNQPPFSPTKDEPVIMVSMSGKLHSPGFSLPLFTSSSFSDDHDGGEFLMHEIGLYTIKHLVELHGGQMGMQNETGDLYRLFFTIPINKLPTRHPKRPANIQQYVKPSTNQLLCSTKA